MVRATCAVVGSLVLFAPAGSPDVDAVTFATAFRAGTADQYRNSQVSGSGVSFHGPIKERLADGSTRTSLVMTLGAAAAAGKIDLIKTWEEFVAAERAGTTLVVALSGPALPEPPSSGPATYEFSGVYDGQVRTIMRAPQASGADPAGGAPAPDSAPCPGEQPRPSDAPGRFHCAALLTGATAKIK